MDLHNPVASPVGPVVVRCQLEKKKKVNSSHLGILVGGVGLVGFVGFGGSQGGGGV